MNEEEKERYGKYLPIGTVVILKEGKKRLMITGFCPTADSDGEKKIFDYCGVIFPEGMITTKSMLLFNHNQIKKIFHMGLYNDEEAMELKQRLKKLVNEKK